MADESQTTIRGINWRETFPFTQVFRAFRVAIHPTKLILALAALLSVYMGGRVLDALWPIGSRAVPGEASHFAEIWIRGGSASPFSDVIKADRQELEDKYVATLKQLNFYVDKDGKFDEGKAKADAKAAARLGDIKNELLKRRSEKVQAIQKKLDDKLKASQSDKNPDNTEKTADQKKEAKEDYETAKNANPDDIRKEYAKATDTYARARQIKGEGIFAEFFDFEVNQVNHVANAVLANDWLGGFMNNPITRGDKETGPQPGVFASLRNLVVVGPWWLVSQHTTYFILFGILFSLVAAVFGGAISRIAAVHVARDEKISVSSALKFSTGKFLSFVFAPIIPLLIVLVVGLVVALGGLLGNIPWIGPVLMGLFFFLALAAGFVMTLVLLGTGGGFNLMYPTIAVEGSDSFDAISRSFSYVYARPWRMLFYSLVAIIYGALCYMFVRFFIAIMLMLTHSFVGWGMMKNVDGSTPIDLWSKMWPLSPARVSYELDTMTLHSDQVLGGFLISIWVYIAIGLLGAFAISFYFSANTIIYYLMRREVDATELDDVYLEQSDEDFADAAAPSAAAPAATAPAATDAPPATGDAAQAPPPAGT